MSLQKNPIKFKSQNRKSSKSPVAENPRCSTSFRESDHEKCDGQSYEPANTLDKEIDKINYASLSTSYERLHQQQKQLPNVTIKREEKISSTTQIQTTSTRKIILDVEIDDEYLTQQGSYQRRQRRMGKLFTDDEVQYYTEKFAQQREQILENENNKIQFIYE